MSHSIHSCYKCSEQNGVKKVHVTTVTIYIKLNICALTINSTFVDPQILPALFQNAFANVGNTVAQKKSEHHYSHCEAILCGHRWFWLRPKAASKWLRKLEVWQLELLCLRLSLEWKMLGNLVCIWRCAFLWILFSAIFMKRKPVSNGRWSILATQPNFQSQHRLNFLESSDGHWYFTLSSLEEQRNRARPLDEMSKGVPALFWDTYGNLCSCFPYLGAVKRKNNPQIGKKWHTVWSKMEMQALFSWCRMEGMCTDYCVHSTSGRCECL